MPTAIRFYSGLFGWRIEPSDTGADSDYWAIGHDGATHGRNGGVREATGTPARWRPYFTVASLDEALARVSAAGGRVVAGPRALRDGRAATVRDPQGAEFGVFEGQVDR